MTWLSVQRFAVFVVLLVSFLDIHPIQCWALDKEPTPEEALFTAGKYSEAIELWTTKIDKLDSKALKLLGQAHSKSNNHPAAIKALQLAIGKDGKDVEAKTLLASEEILIKKERDAMVLLKEALKIDSKYEPAYLLIEKIYVAKKNNYELRTLYSDMVENIGEKPEYVTRLCELNSQSGLYDAAKTYCRRGIVLKKEEPKNYVILAGALRASGAVEQARSLYKRAADNFQNSVDAQIGYAQFLDEEKNYIDSSKYYKRATEADPDVQQAWIGLAFSSEEIQKYQDTYDALAAACKINRQKMVSAMLKIKGQLRILKEEKWTTKIDLLDETCNTQYKKD